MQRWIAVFMAVCFWGIAAAGQAFPASSEVHSQESTAKLLDVGLFTRQTAVKLSATAPYVLRDAITHKLIGKFSAETQTVIEKKGSKLLVNQKTITSQALELAAQDEKKPMYVKVGRKTYRGTLLVQQGSSGLTVINRVPLEAYLYGVLPEEMPSQWPQEALKAQAVAARTFALYNQHQHQREGFDVCADSHCQVYGGIAAEQPAARSAVDSTRGEVLLYQGKPIYAAFHTCSGGMTENSEDVWGNYQPYLRAVPDEDEAAPGRHWKVKFTAPQMQIKLQNAGYQIGVLQKIQLTPWKAGQGKTEDRSVSGRVRMMKFMGSKGTASLTGLEARKVFGLKSTLFDVLLQRPQIQSIDVDLGLDQDKKIAVNLPDVMEKNYTVNKLHVLSGVPGEVIVLDGYGWGHGMGLSQWGARAMAAHADYRQILAHYYQKTQLKKLY